MKQVIQHLRTGETSVVDTPVPSVSRGKVLVHVRASLVSPGTERMVVDFAEKNLIQKARSRPDLVRQTIDKTRREGIMTTLEVVRSRLDQPIGLGYSCAGTVVEVDSAVPDLKVGDHVACAGTDAAHAELVSVSKNLVVRLPEELDLEAAAFTTLGAIAMQGVRLAGVNIGEVVAVIGLGLLGQLTIQILKSAGCTVVGMDIQPQRIQLGRSLGADAVTTDADELLSICHQLTAGHGADAVLITADTKSNQPVELSGEVAREKGIVVAVGAVGMTIPRKVFYDKELDFRISRSYGPGRYDPTYEVQGHDYPYGYVRWTEQRNMQAFVQLLAEGRVDVQPLVSHRFSVDDAPIAYDLITGKIGEPFLGVLLTYPEVADLGRKVLLGPRHDQADHYDNTAPKARRVPRVRLGLIGSGNFANGTLLPRLKELSSIDLVGVASGAGLSARTTASRFGFSYCTTDTQEILGDSSINTVAILTRHHLHAQQILAALTMGKHVFCEKPLCLNKDEIVDIIAQYRARIDDQPLLMVGYNRRFAPLARQLKSFLANVGKPLIMHYRVNAGYIPLDHWIHDPEQGGGRIIGEACHFIDFLTFLADSMVVRIYAQALPRSHRYHDDNVVIHLAFANGSLGTVTYVANGDRRFPKERVEVFGGGSVAVLDDFRELELVRDGHRKVHKSRLRQDKGHLGIWEAYVAALVSGGAAPIPFHEIVATTLSTFYAVDSLRSGMPVDVDINSVEERSPELQQEDPNDANGTPSSR